MTFTESGGHVLKVLAKLGIVALPDWLQALKFLAECYKHDPVAWPDKKLLEALRLPAEPSERLVRWYASLPDSGLIEEGLLQFLGLPKEATFCDIAEAFLGRAEEFIDELRARPDVLTLRRAPASLCEFEG